MGPDDAGKPLTRAFRPLPEALVFSAYPFSQVEGDPTQTLIERRFVEVTVVIDPTPDIRIAHSGQVIEGLVGLGLKAPAPDITAELLERLIGCRRQERDAVFAAATVHPLQPLPVGLHLLEGLPDFPLRDVERLCLGHAAPPVTGWPPTSAGHRSPFGPVPLQNLHPYYGLLRPCAPHRYSGSCGGLPLELLPWHRGDRFPRSTKEPDPGSRRLQAGRRSGRASGLRPNSSQGPLPSPWFRHRPVNFGTSSAVRLRSSLRISPDGIKSRLFLRRSPPPLLTAAARSGLKPAPDRRLRGACPHLFCRSTPPLQSVCSRRTQWASLKFCLIDNHSAQWPGATICLSRSIVSERMVWVSAILALTVPGVVLVGYLNRRGSPGEQAKGIGWQFIRYTVLTIAIPIVGVLALNDALNGEAATLIAGAMGFAFGKASKDD